SAIPVPKRNDSSSRRGTMCEWSPSGSRRPGGPVSVGRDSLMPSANAPNSEALRSPPARWTRRELLRIGTLGAGGLGLAQLLRQEANAAPTPRAPVQSVILLQHYGAPSHIDLWDPKPAAPAEIRGEFNAIASS